MTFTRPLIASFVVAALATLAACGKQEAPAAPAAAPETTTAAPAAASTEPAAAPASTTEVAAAAAPAAADAGKATYGKVCVMCHGAGVAGAPKPGDKAAWAPRIAQGKDTLYKHAIEGFTGSQGMMPAKGGSPSLSDDEIKAVVDYMVAQSK